MSETIQYLLSFALFLVILAFLIVIIQRIRLFFVSRRRENNHKTGMITIINEKAEDNEAYFSSDSVGMERGESANSRHRCA